jgi:uncharacterized protein (TIGR03435 family)
MMRWLVVAAVALAAHAQSFEVASIRPSAPMETIAQQVQAGKLHLGLYVDQARVDIAFLTLGDLIPLAWRVKPHQVSAPEWMQNDRWDILAKLPEGATKAQVPEMLQALLRDRFKLEVHKETREKSVYVLTGGSKLKEATAPVRGSGAFATAVAEAPQGKVERSEDGRTMIVSGGAAGTIRMTDVGQDAISIRMNATIPALVDLLQLDKPVVDQTDLKGEYELTLVVPNNTAKVLMRSAMGIGMFGGPQDSMDAAPITQALAKAGLKLESRKMAMEVIVVDRAEKRPTEN